MFVACDDGRAVDGSHALLAIGSLPNTEELDCDAAGVVVDDNGYVPGNRHCQTNVPHIYSAGDISGRLPLSSVAAMQGRKIAEHVMGLTARAHRHLDYDKAAQAIFTDPEIAEVGVAEAEAFAAGRKLRVTKVPFSVEPEVADQRRRARLREDPLRSRDRRRARRRDRRSQRRRADLGDRGRGHEQPPGRRHRRLAARAPRAGRVARRSRVLMPSMRALVTGAAGFVGSHLAEALLARGDTVVGVDCFTPYYDRVDKEHERRGGASRTTRFELVEADLRTADVEALLDGVDVVFHQAAQAGVRLSWSDGFADYVGHNVLATQRLLEAVQRARPSARVVYASSSSVYGNQPRYPTLEDRPARSRSAPTASPSSRPSTSAASTRRTGACTPCRCGTSRCSDRGSGPTCRSTGCARPRSTASSFPRYGDGTQIREFTYVERHRRRRTSPPPTRDVAPGTYVNLAGGAEITLNDLIALVGEVAGAPVAIDPAARAGRRLVPQRRRRSTGRASARMGTGGVAARRDRRPGRLAPFALRDARASGEQLAAQHRDRVAEEQRAVAGEGDADGSAPSRRLLRVAARSCRAGGTSTR